MADHRIDALKQKRDQLNAQIAKLNARKAAESRRVETRRKIVAGALLLEAVASDRAAEKPVGIARWWDVQVTRLKRPQDRALFGLPPNDSATES